MAALVRTRSELISELGGRRAFDRAVLDGDFIRPVRGAYIPGDEDLSPLLKAKVAKRLLPKGAYLADRFLLWMWDVDVLPPGPPVLEAVVSRGDVIPRRQGFKVREAALPDRDVWDWNGVPCLRPPRAVCDLLRRLPAGEALACADASFRATLCSRADLEQELVNHAKLRGVRQALYLAGVADARAESPPESKVRLQLLEAGLAPVPQFEVRHNGRWLARVDLAFPELKIAIEYDGREFHTKENAFVRDRQRQNDLVSAGWIVLRFTASDLYEGRVVRAVLTAMRQAAAWDQASRTA